MTRRSTRARLRADHDGTVGLIAELLDRLLVDLARLGYGEYVAFEYVVPSLAHELRGLYPGGIQGGWTVEADYRDSAEVHARVPDAAAADQALAAAEIALEDRSVIRSRVGAAIAAPPCRYHLAVTIDLHRRCITDVRCGTVSP